MDAVKALKRLINKNAVVPIENNGKQCSFKLIESQPNYALVVTKCPDDVLIIKCDDKFPAPTNIFKGEKGECKRADYIIVSSKEKSMLIIELKHSDNSKAKDIEQQLRGAKCFLDYCESIISSFWGDTNILCEYDERYFKYIHCSRKRSFKPEADKTKNNSPDRFGRIYDKVVPFGKLIR